MSGIIQNKIFTIYGPPGSGKTWFACFLAAQHRIIYSNFEITRYGKTVSNAIKQIDDLESIPFCEEKGIAVIDEGGVNFNARRSQSDANMEF